MSQALYYPSIEFRDSAFLKRSLLVWDRVFRIVPRGYVPRDSREVATAKSASAVVDLVVDDQEKASAARGFLDFYARMRRSRTLTWPAGLDSPSFVRINPDKIEARLRPLFEQLLAKLSKDGFMYVPPDLAGGFMFYLAEAVARSRKLHMVTDLPDTWTVGSYFAQAGNFTDYVQSNEADAYLCNLAIDDVLPSRLGHVSMNDVLRFTEEHADERAVFRREIERLRKQITGCKNKEHARYIVSDGVKRLVRAKMEYAKAIGAFGKQELSCVLSTGLPATAAFMSLVAGAGGDPFTTGSIGAGLFVGGVAALAKKKLIPTDKGVGSYLVAAAELRVALNVNLRERFEEFIND